MTRRSDAELLAEAMELLHRMPVLLMSPEVLGFLGKEAQDYDRDRIEHKKKYLKLLVEVGVRD
jgi:hypothetical protein